MHAETSNCGNVISVISVNKIMTTLLNNCYTCVPIVKISVFVVSKKKSTPPPNLSCIFFHTKILVCVFSPHCPFCFFCLSTVFVLADKISRVPQQETCSQKTFPPHLLNNSAIFQPSNSCQQPDNAQNCNHPEGHQ